LDKTIKKSESESRKLCSKKEGLNELSHEELDAVCGGFIWFEKRPGGGPGSVGSR
jgi:hypothetical protein